MLEGFCAAECASLTVETFQQRFETRVLELEAARSQEQGGPVVGASIKLQITRTDLDFYAIYMLDDGERRST